MIKRTLTNREKIFFYIAMAAIALSLFVNYCFRPLNYRFSATRSRIISAQRLLKEYAALQSNQAQLAKLEVLLPFYEKKPVPAAEKVSLILKDLEDISARVGVKIETLRPLATAGGGQAKALKFELKLEGAITPVMQFLYIVEAPLRAMVAEKLQLSAKNQDLLTADIIISYQQ